MSGRKDLRNKVAIIGHAQSPTIRRPTETLGVTALKTAREAIADAGMTPQQIDGFVAATMLPSSGAHELEDGISIVSAEWMAGHLGADPHFISGFQGYGQITGSVNQAVNALASGAVDYVLLHRALYNPPGRYNNNAMTHVAGLQQWNAPQGFFGALPGIAMAYTEYSQRYGCTREATARIAVEARKHGARNPLSYWYGKPLTIEDYLAEPLLVDPMSRLDCDIPVQGVAAFVMTTAERAKDHPHKPVYIAGYANGYGFDRRIHLNWTLDEMEREGDALAKRLWEGTGYTAKDVQLPQVYDAFSPFVYIWLEALGFVPRGEAHRLVLDGGIDSDNPGAIPVLTGGGALGCGRLHGLPQMLECYRQLAGRAGERQREASVGLMSYSAPSLGGVVVFTNDPA